MTNVFAIGADGCSEIDVTIVMPCLNEAEWLPKLLLPTMGVTTGAN
jgi:hypothetical protein